MVSNKREGHGYLQTNLSVELHPATLTPEEKSEQKCRELYAAGKTRQNDLRGPDWGRH